LVIFETMNTEADLLHWDLGKHGDLLEVLTCDFVRGNIPAYESTWSSYIGRERSGPANLLDPNGDILDTSSELCKQRQRFAQHHYTALEALYSLSTLEMNPGGGEYLQYHGSFLKVSEQLVLFHAQLGRMTDNLGRAATAVGLRLSSEKEGQLDTLYDPRCDVLHGPRIPIMYGPWVPQIEDAPSVACFILEPATPSWDAKRSLWTDIRGEGEYKKITTYVAEKRERAISTASAVFQTLHSAVMNLMKQHKIRLAAPLKPSYQRYGGSGIQYSSWENVSIAEFPDTPLSGSQYSVGSETTLPGSSPDNGLFSNRVS
jgi:hypothetical protein